MFSAAQVNRLAASISTARFAAFPCQMTYRGNPVTGTCTSLKTVGKVEWKGFTFTHDAVARIPLAAAAAPNPPASGEQVIVFMPGGPAAGQPMRIAEVHNHPTNPEWRLGLEKL